MRERFIQQGAEPTAVSPAEATKFFAAETTKWGDIITKAGHPEDSIEAFSGESLPRT